MNYIPYPKELKNWSNEELLDSLISAAVDSNEMGGFKEVIKVYRTELLRRLNNHV